MTPIERGLRLAKEGKVKEDEPGNKRRYFIVTNEKGEQYNVSLEKQQIWECDCEHGSRYIQRAMCAHVYACIFYEIRNSI